MHCPRCDSLLLEEKGIVCDERIEGVMCPMCGFRLDETIAKNRRERKKKC